MGMVGLDRNFINQRVLLDFLLTGGGGVADNLSESSRFSACDSQKIAVQARQKCVLNDFYLIAYDTRVDI